MSQANRRDFLRGASAVVSAGLLESKAFASPPPPTFVRRDIATLSATDPVITSYRKAIKAMRALPISNPLSWGYQAAIHRTTQPGPPPVAWNSCTHGSYFFWPWHRMYLYWFERIIRKMSGDSTWALPYWDWSSPNERKLPAVFRDTSSELFTTNRNSAMNSGSGSLPAPDVNYASAFALPGFTAASASLEGTPHGAVHVDVGGWMASVPTAAQDPIFFLHHCNIDRLWNLWLAQGGGRADPLSDSAWKSHVFTFFDENGHAVTNTPCDVLRAQEQLNYTYQVEPAQVKEYCLRIIKFPIWKWILVYRCPIPPVELNGELSRVIVDLSPVREKLAAIARSPEQKLSLTLEGVEAERQPGISWEVFLGTAEPAQLSTESPQFLGLVVLFGLGIKNEAHMGFEAATFNFAINPKEVESLLKNPKVPLTFVPHGILIDGKPSRPKPQVPVRIGSVSISVGSGSAQ